MSLLSSVSGKRFRDLARWMSTRMSTIKSTRISMMSLASPGRSSRQLTGIFISRKECSMRRFMDSNELRNALSKWLQSTKSRTLIRRARDLCCSFKDRLELARRLLQKPSLNLSKRSRDLLVSRVSPTYLSSRETEERMLIRSQVW